MNEEGKLEIVFAVEDDETGGYTAYALGESIFTEGDTLDELRGNIKDAVRCHYGDDPGRPRVIRLHFVRQEVLAV